jgi:hypothetical protein
MAEMIQVPLVWVDGDDAPVFFANQFLLQPIGPAEFILSLGQAVPPPLIGTPEEQKEQAKRIAFVGVRTMSRFSLPRQRIEELVGVLQNVLKASIDAEGEAP